MLYICALSILMKMYTRNALLVLLKYVQTKKQLRLHTKLNCSNKAH